MNRPEKPIFGAIRWDAWMPEQQNPVNPGFQIAETVNKPEYRWRAPFFAVMKNGTDVTWPDFTQEIWEQEADYAAKAGIDYFAYLWYDDHSDLSAARKRHMASKDPDRVKMCCILECRPLHRCQEDQEQLAEAMNSRYYLRVDGKPVVYCYTTFPRTEVDQFRQEMKASGVKEELLLFTMGGLKIEEAIEVGYNGISRYSFGCGGGISFPEQAQKVLEWNENAAASGFPVVPFLTCGWDPRPRRDRPVTWMKVGETSWGQNATPQELADHFRQMLAWNDSHPKEAPTNLLLAYAWNEHDEGGWLCPTIQTDETGKPILKDGRPVPDTSHLDAIAAVLKEYK